MAGGSTIGGKENSRRRAKMAANSWTLKHMTPRSWPRKVDDQPQSKHSWSDRR